MAMGVKVTNYATSPQVLMFPEDFRAFSVTIEQGSSLATDVDGRKIVKAGTVYPANDATAKGIVLNDCDVTDFDCAAAIVYEGAINALKLPAAISSAAAGVLPRITVFGA